MPGGRRKQGNWTVKGSGEGAGGRSVGGLVSQGEALAFNPAQEKQGRNKKSWEALATVSVLEGLRGIFAP